MASVLAATAACTTLVWSLSSPPINVLPPRYASWNIDSSRDRDFFDADLSSVQLRYLLSAASAGNHSSLRFGGTGNDFLFYGGIGGSPTCAPTKPFAYECLNTTLFSNLLALAGEANAPLVFGLNIHPATGAPSPPKGPWDPSNARFLLAEAQRRGNLISHLECAFSRMGGEGERALAPHALASHAGAPTQSQHSVITHSLPPSSLSSTLSQWAMSRTH